MILNQITIPCLDYTASVEFYKALGLVQIVSAPPRYARFESADGRGATLSCHRVLQGEATGVVVYFDFPTREALDDKVAELKSVGLTFLQEPVDQSWGWREARILDPSNNQVCLMYAGSARRFPAWRIDGRAE
ncbi:MAG: VOC family protein [Henriciella sp.]|jgi:hydroxymethylpyrimidine/phosphomethylpyrimidine kinase